MLQHCAGSALWWLSVVSGDNCVGGSCNRGSYNRGFYNGWFCDGLCLWTILIPLGSERNKKGLHNGLMAQGMLICTVVRILVHFKCHPH